MGLFVTKTPSQENDKTAHQARQAHLRMLADDIQSQETEMKTIERECDALHAIRIQLETDNKKVSHELNDDLLLIKKMENELHTVTLRMEKSRKETDRIGAEIRENDKKYAEKSRELLRQQAELKQAKKKFQDQSH